MLFFLRQSSRLRRPSGLLAARMFSSSQADTALMSVAELRAKLQTPEQPKIIDASWFMPNDAEGRTGAAAYSAAHIPGAVFLDVDEVKTPSPLPHMMPDAATLSAKLGQLGISRDDEVVVYDSNMFLASARVWLMLRHFGHPRVKVLDGGLKAWLAQHGHMEHTQPTPQSTDYVMGEEQGDVDLGLVVDKDQVLAALSGAGTSLNVLDARPNGRFTGELPEPRAGLPSGHMPGSTSVPFMTLISPDGSLVPRAGLRDIFQRAGVEDVLQSTITTCGSGVSAPVINLGLYELGHRGGDCKMYDGSWTEWAADPDTPKQKSA